MKKILLSSTFALGILAIGSTAVLAEGGPRGGHGPQMNFERLDTNGDGMLTLEELQARGQSKFAETDTNSDGFLDVEELAAAAERERAQMIERLLERKDTNGDGMLSIEEMAPDNAGKLFERADTNGDGMIDADEWEAAQKHMRGQHGRQGNRGGN